MTDQFDGDRQLAAAAQGLIDGQPRRRKRRTGVQEEIQLRCPVRIDEVLLQAVRLRRSSGLDLVSHANPGQDQVEEDHQGSNRGAASAAPYGLRAGAGTHQRVTLARRHELPDTTHQTTRHLS